MMHVISNSYLVFVQSSNSRSSIGCQCHFILSSSQWCFVNRQELVDEVARFTEYLLKRHR